MYFCPSFLCDFAFFEGETLKNVKNAFYTEGVLLN